MASQQAKNDEYQVQAIVIPRTRDRERHELHVCITFAVLAPDALDPTTAPRVPEQLKNWPRLLDGWLAGARLLVNGAPRRFTRWWPRDLQDWSAAQSQRAWSALFGEVDFGAPEPAPAAASAKTVADFRKVYETPTLQRDLQVNPASATELNPVNRVEAPNPLLLREGIAAAHMQSVRAANPLARAELDARYLAALTPGQLHDGLTRFAQALRHEPERYARTVAAALPVLVGLVADSAPAHQEVMAALPPADRQAIIGEFVAFQLGNAIKDAAPEYERVDRVIRSARDRRVVDTEQVEGEIKRPTFLQLVARIRQYPGLARRLSLIVHGAIPAVPQPDSPGRIQLDMPADALRALKWKLPETLYELGPGHFRPRPKDPDSFAPSGTGAFFRHHLYDAALYRVTQQDMVQAAARANAADADSAVRPPAPVKDSDPPPDAAFADEVARYRSNAVLFVKAPKLPPAPPAAPQRPDGDAVSAAHAVDARVRDSLRSLAAHPNAPDGSLGAEDLMVGVTVFVRPMRAGAALPWASLCRRMVHVSKDGCAVVPAFEEEGFVATGTNLVAPSKVGLVTALDPDRPSLLRQPLLEQTDGGGLRRRQHRQLKIKRLMSANTILAQEEPLDLQVPARYFGPFGRYVTADDVYVNDIVHATLGSGSRYVAIEVVPLLKFFGQPGTAALPLLFVQAATPQRLGQRFVVHVDEQRTQCLNEFGKPLNADTKESCRLFFVELNRPPAANAPATEFFVEGPRRLWLAGPKFGEAQTSSALQELVPAKISQAPLNNATVLLHKSIPSAVLRRRHLRDGDDYRPLPLAEPAANPGARWQQADVREVLTPLTHIRGTVTAIAFDLTVTLQRLAVGAKPTRLFLNIWGQTWEIQADGPQVAATDDARLSGPKLFSEQVAAVVGEGGTVAAARLAEAQIRALVGGLMQLPPAPPGLTDERVADLVRLQALCAAWSQVPPPAALLLAGQAVLAASDQGLASLNTALFGSYYIDNTEGGVALKTNPLVTVALRPGAGNPGQMRVRLLGQVETGVAANRQRTCTLRVTGAQNVPEPPPGGNGPSIKWLLSVVPPGAPTAVTVEYDPTVRDRDGKLTSYFDQELSNDPTYIHPLDSHGFLVDCVTDGGSARLGRAWPQALPGSTWRLRVGNGLRPHVFQTVDGYFLAPVVTPPQFAGPAGEEVVTGYYLVRPLGQGGADSGALTSGRVTPTLPQGDNPNEAYLALVAGARPEPTSYLLWPALAQNTPLPLVAEVRKASPAQFELVTLDERLVTLSLVDNEANQDVDFQPPQANLPRRRLSDLVAGELILTHGHVWPDRTCCTPEPRRFVIDKLPNSELLKLSSAVRGTFQRVASEPSQIPRDGNSARAVLRTPSGAEVMVWGDKDELKNARPNADYLTVITPVTEAERISIWKQPREVTTEEPHVNALASDVLAKWANWSLTVPMPDQPGDSSQEQLDGPPPPFQIRCDRNHRETAHWAESQVGKWELPPLRFGETYEFLLRRVDFAGNHLFDELLPADVPAEAVRKLESMLGSTAAARAVLPPARRDEDRFVRAELPQQAPLAFPIANKRPAWQTGPGAAEQHAECHDFRYVAFKREPLLILFSDVFGRADPVARDAYCYLLPPAAPVETVLMHGKFDRAEPVGIPQVIRCHERYMVQGCLGVDQRGQLNYFGDPQVKKLRFDFVFLQKETVGNAPAAAIAESTVFEHWPRPRPVRLQIALMPAADDGRVPTNLSSRQPLTACTLAAG